MPLRGVEPETITKRLKMFVYGAAGCGKTYAAIQFPKPYVIDTEKGTENKQYVQLIKNGGGRVFRSTDFDEVFAEVKSLLINHHDFKTLIIDSITIIYDDLLEKCAHKLKSANDPSGSANGRHYHLANTRFKQLINLVLQLDMNIIITSHAKVQYGESLIVLGETFDAYKKMDFLFDLMLEIRRKNNTKNVIAIVKKTRIDEFPFMDQFTFSYQEVANRYGHEIMEKQAAVVELATNEQYNQLMQLSKELEIPSTTLETWLNKAGVDSFSSMLKQTMDKCINFLLEKKRQQYEFDAIADAQSEIADQYIEDLSKVSEIVKQTNEEIK